MYLFRLAYKNIIHRKARFIFTILAVVFGVMFVAGTFSFTDGLREIFNTTSQEIAGNSSVIIRTQIDFGDRNTAPPVPREIQGIIAGVAGVNEVKAGVAREGLTVSETNENGGDRIDPSVEGPPVIGIGWDGNTRGYLGLVAEYGDGSGRPPKDETEFAIELASANANNMILGNQYTVTIPRGSFAGAKNLTLVGVIKLGNAGQETFSAQLVILELETAATYFNDDLGYDQYDVYLDSGVNPAQAVKDIDVALEGSPVAKGALSQAGIQVEIIQTQEFADEISSFFNGFIDILRNVFLGFSIIILLVSGFVIFNTFSIVLDQRIKEFGLLRAIGLSGKQLMRLVLGEALIVGIIATLVGMAASVGVFYGFVAFISRGGGFPSIDFIFSARTVLVSFAVGIGTTILASLPAAFKSRRIPPVAALREGVSATRQTEVVHQPVLGLIVFVTGVGLAVTSLFLSWIFLALLTLVGGLLIYWGGTRLAKWAGHFAIFGLGVAWLILASGILTLKTGEAMTLLGMGAIFVFLGVNLLSPLFGIQLTKGLGVPIIKFSKVIGNLGVSNAARNPKRTATTAGALMIGIALLSVAAVFSSSIKATFTEALEGTVRSDLIVCKATCSPEDSFSPGISDRVLNSQYVRSVAAFSEEGEGFKVVATETNSEITIRDQIFSVASTDLTIVDEHLNLSLEKGEKGNGDVSKRNGVYVKKSRAEKYNLEVGSGISVQFPSGGKSPPVALEVVGIFSATSTVFNSDWLVQQSLIEENLVGLDIYTISVLLVPGTSVDLTNSEDPVLAMINEDLYAEQGILGIEPDITILTKSELNKELQASLNQVLVIISAFLFISFLVAIFGVANTLALSIFERTREIGLLRAIGMKRGQVRRMIVVEGFIIGVFGSLVGVVMGVAFGIVGTKVIPDEFVNQLAVDPRNLLIYVVGGIISALIGTIIPSIRAGRLNILDAISQP